MFQPVLMQFILLLVVFVTYLGFGTGMPTGGHQGASKINREVISTSNHPTTNAKSQEATDDAVCDATLLLGLCPPHDNSNSGQPSATIVVSAPVSETATSFSEPPEEIEVATAVDVTPSSDYLDEIDSLNEEIVRIQSLIESLPSDSSDINIRLKRELIKNQLRNVEFEKKNYISEYHKQTNEIVANQNKGKSML